MLDTLIQLDKQWLLALNSSGVAFWDYFWYLFTLKEMWFPLYAVVVYRIIKMYGPRGWMAVIALALLIAIVDQTTTYIFKEGIQRFRPCQDPDVGSEVVRVFGKCGGKYGFFSAHSANSMAFAVFASWLMKSRPLTLLLVAWSVLTGFSRIYLGVHFPFDVLSGFTYGGILGWAMINLMKQIWRYKDSVQENYSYIVLTLVITVFTILIASMKL